jgi:hypothetical protein
LTSFVSIFGCSKSTRYTSTFVYSYILKTSPRHLNIMEVKKMNLKIPYTNYPDEVSLSGKSWTTFIECLYEMNIEKHAQKPSQNIISDHEVKKYWAILNIYIFILLSLIDSFGFLFVNW